MSSTGARVAEWIWESDNVSAQIARGVLSPASALFGAVVRTRNARFDEALNAPAGTNQRVRSTVLPALSVGNLTVGGTGKTPVAAWCAHELQKHGKKPSIVLRGYGDDEWRVHMALNPGVPVVVAPDRLNGIALAATRGANCVVMDDAFQHRQAARRADIVLISADKWTGNCRLLPSGPFREPLSALKRATTVVITVKAAAAQLVSEVEDAINAAAPGSHISVVKLGLGPLRLAATLPKPDPDGIMRPIRTSSSQAGLDRPRSWLEGRNIVAVSAIGDPMAFLRQLEAAGARVTLKRYMDHYAFTAQDAEKIAREAEHTDGVVCTLKDAVKLGPLWPRVAPPLWYVSQQVVVERGASALDRALARLL